MTEIVCSAFFIDRVVIDLAFSDVFVDEDVVVVGCGVGDEDTAASDEVDVVSFSFSLMAAFIKFWLGAASDG